MPPQQTASVPQRRSLDTYSIFALIATFVLALFFFIPSNSVPFTATKTFLLAAGTLVTLALYVLARLSRGNVILPSFMLLGTLWLPVIAYALSATFSGAPFGNSLWGLALEPDTLGFMLVITILGTLTALVLRRADQYRTFLKASAYVFCILVALQILVLLIGQVAPSFISPSFSILGSYEDLAFILGLGVLASLITLRFLALGERARKMLTLGSVGALFLLAVANSSLVWTLIAFASLGLFVESVMRRAKGAQEADPDGLDNNAQAAPSVGGAEGSHSITLALAVLAVSLFFLVGGTLGGALASSLHVNVLSVRPSWQSTLMVAQKTYTTAPVFGTGPGTFGTQWLTYRDTSLNSTVFWNTDFTSGIGFIPTSFVTTGILGALAWIGFLFLLIFLGLKTVLERASRDPYTNYVSILSFVLATYLFALAVFSLPSGVMLALAFVFAGLFVSSTRFAEGGQQWGIIFSRSPRVGFVIVFLLTILLLGTAGTAYRLVGHYVSVTSLTRANAAFVAGDYDGADRAAQTSISFAPSAAAYQVQAGVANAKLNEILASSTMPTAVAQQAFQAALSYGINAALSATRIAPKDYQNWLALGSLYAQAVPLNVEGAYDSAKQSYEKAKELNPTNPQVFFILAQLDIANKDTKAAQEDLKAAISLKQDYTAAIFLLSQLLVQDGNVKDALASALAAAYFTPNDPNILFQVGILYAAESDLPNAAAALAAAVEVSPQFANARYFLSAVYAKQGDFENAVTQMQAIADLSAENAEAVASQLASLKDGKNPFPANLLSVTPADVQ